MAVLKVEPYPDMEWACTHINVQTITPQLLVTELGLPGRGGDSRWSTPSIKAMARHFGPFSMSTRTFRMEGELDPLFQELAMFLLQTGLVHSTRTCTMPLKFAGLIMATYQGDLVDWVTITATHPRQAILTRTSLEKSAPTLPHWVTFLYSLLVDCEPPLKKSRIIINATSEPQRN
jgi:hypothetical protein